jgi:hypothetical protein
MDAIAAARLHAPLLIGHMDLPRLDLDQLATRLRPCIDAALKEVSDFVDEFTSDLSKKAAGGLTDVTLRGLRSIGTAAWRRIKSSRAHVAFQRRWKEAKSTTEKEQAIRLLLSSDPKVASSLYGLLVKRDFVRAVMEHCEHLPNIGLLDATRRLSDIYVPLSLNTSESSGVRQPLPTATGKPTVSNDPDDTIGRLRSGNHLIEGIPGSGKSTLARRVVIQEARRLIESPEAVAFDQLRLPVFVTAKSLAEAKTDFASSLYRAVSADMSFAGLGPLPQQFFVPYSDTGHSSWFVVIDGLDEIEDRRERQRLWDTVSQLHSQFGDAFRFVVTSRPDAIRIRENVAGFTRSSLCPMAMSTRASLAHRYIDEGRKAEQFIDRIRHGAFADVMSTPLFEAIAASVFAKTGKLPSTKLELCEAFAHTLIETRACNADNYRAFERLISKVAANPREDFHNQLAERGIEELIPRNLPRLRVRDHLEELLVHSGLIRASAGGYSFFMMSSVPIS